jgi:hypothetical protein
LPVVWRPNRLPFGTGIENAIVRLRVDQQLALRVEG